MEHYQCSDFPSFTRIPILNYSETHIHRLPVELLQQVFVRMVNAEPHCLSILLYGEKIPVNVVRFPLLLTRVCRRWRLTTHSPKEIWSRLEHPGVSYQWNHYFHLCSNFDLSTLETSLSPFTPFTKPCRLIGRAARAQRQCRHQFPEAGFSLLIKRCETVTVDFKTRIHEEWFDNIDTQLRA